MQTAQNFEIFAYLVLLKNTVKKTSKNTHSSVYYIELYLFASVDFNSLVFQFFFLLQTPNFIVLFLSIFWRFGHISFTLIYTTFYS